MQDDARLADHLQAPNDPWRSLAQYFQAVALYLTGDRTGALALLEDAERLAEVLGAHSPRACILAQLALVAIEQGEWDRAEQLAQEATAVTEEHDLGDLATTGSVVSVAALLLTHSGRLDEARRRARQARRAMAQNARIAPWNGVQARVVLARAYLLLGDAPAARVLLSEAQNLVKQVSDAPTLRARLDEAWRMAETLPVSTGAGPSALTTAELRVLQFLPTHLSFEEVGKRLCLSRNTVKTQAIAAYRKLGVSSRAEAVEQAHRCGLLPEVDRSTSW